MGRHSAPSDDDETGEPAVVWADAPTADQLAERWVAQRRADEVFGRGAAATAPTRPVPSIIVDPALSPARADLSLLRAVPGLRAQALAAVIVPFLIYTLVMVLIGRVDIYLIWLWIPTVLAGVTVGHLLDRAHHRLIAPAEPPAESED